MLMGRVDDVLVYLVGDDVEIVLLGQAGDFVQLSAGKDVPAGVGGVAEDECLGAGQGAGGLQLGVIKGEHGSV